MQKTRSPKYLAQKPRNAWKRWVIALSVISVLGISCAGGYRFFRGWRQERLITRAQALLDNKDFSGAALTVRRALQVDPQSVPATRLMGDLMEAANLREALNWRHRLAELEPGVPENHYACVELALHYGEIEMAKKALAKVSESQSNTARYHEMAARLAVVGSDVHAAEDEFSKAAALDPHERRYQVDLAQVRLASADQGVRSAARSALETFIDDPEFSARVLRTLIQDAVVNRQPERALNYGGRLLKARRVNFDDALLVLGLLKKYNPARYPSFLNRLQEGSEDKPASVYALISWLNANGSALLAIEWSKRLPREIVTTPPVSVAIAKCYANVGDWAGLKSLVVGPDESLVENAAVGGTERTETSGTEELNWAGYEFMRHALLARALREEGSIERSQGEWSAAVQAATGRGHALRTLAKAAMDWSWENESTDVLWLIARGPENQGWALKELFRRYFESRSTGKLQQVVARAYELDKNNAWAESNFANFSLLLGIKMDQATEMTADLYRRQPDNPVYVANYAFALHLNGQSDEGLRLMGGLSPDQLRQPEYAAYYGILLAETGDGERAMEFLNLAKDAVLLPEERKFVEDAKARVQERRLKRAAASP